MRMSARKNGPASEILDCQPSAAWRAMIWGSVMKPLPQLRPARFAARGWCCEEEEGDTRGEPVCERASHCSANEQGVSAASPSQPQQADKSAHSRKQPSGRTLVAALAAALDEEDGEPGRHLPERVHHAEVELGHAFFGLDCMRVLSYVCV